MRPWYRKYPSLVIALIFAAVVGAWYGAKAYSDAQIARQPLALIAPSRVTFLALKQTSGYRIVIKNGQPSVIQMSDEEARFGDPESSTADKVRVPQDKLLRSLTGDPDALGALLLAMRDVRQDERRSYQTVPVTIPVSYNVLGKLQTVDSRMAIPVDTESEFLHDSAQLARWKQSLRGQEFVERAIRLLNSCEVVLTEKHLSEAWYTTTEIAFENQKRYALHFQLTEEGRRRLLQETSKHLGEQLIVYADDVPVANPVVREQLNVRQADIPNVTNEDLVLLLMQTLRQVGVKVTQPDRAS